MTPHRLVFPSNGHRVLSIKQSLSVVLWSGTGLGLAGIAAMAALAAAAGVSDDTSPGILPAMLLLAGGTAVTVTASALRLVRRERDADALQHRRSEELGQDHATSALSRRRFLEVCTQTLLEPSPQETRAYVALDMDYLKTLNDALGHEVGDAALRHLVTTVRRHLPPGTPVGRLGGDEFAFLVTCGDSRQAVAMAEAILEDLLQVKTLEGAKLSLSATMGITILPKQTTFLSEAVQFSDLALYEGKREGRGRAKLFTMKMLGDFRRERQIERELKTALTRGELQQCYKPIFDENKRIVAARAVRRWKSPWLGEIAEEVFVRVAEKSTLIDDLGEWSWRQASRDAMRFGTMAVSVPVSSGQLKRDRVVEMAERVAQETQMPSRRLIALVGRTIAQDGQRDIEPRLRALQALGARVSLDDFGAVVCDFERLRNFPVDLVRIHGRQIEHLGQTEADNAVVSAMVSVASAMKLIIVADGIANDEQFVLARAAGCQYFAGPFLATPLTADAFAERLAAQDSVPAIDRSRATG